MTEKELGTTPIKKLFFKLAIPNLFSMFFMSLYVIIDGIIVGKFIGEDALSAVNLIMPIFSITTAIPDLIAIGSSVKISIALGEGDEKKASGIFTLAMVMIFTLSLFFMGLALIFLKPITYMAIEDVALARYAYEYAIVFVLLLPLITPMFAVDNYLRACGRARYSMIVNITVAVLNTILDILFVAVFKWGMWSAALASAISMSTATIMSLTPFAMKKLTLRFGKPIMKIKLVIAIFHNGVADFLNNISHSLMSIVMNAILLVLGGSVAVASYSVLMYMNTLFFAMVYGIVDAIQPAISYNYGAKKGKRMMELFSLSCKSALIISLFNFAIMMLFPEFLAKMFAENGNTTMIEMTANAIIWYAPCYLFTWFNIVSASFMTGYSKPDKALVITLSRSAIFPAIIFACAYYLKSLNGIFASMSISNFCTMIVAMILWVKVKSMLRKEMDLTV